MRKSDSSRSNSSKVYNHIELEVTGRKKPLVVPERLEIRQPVRKSIVLFDELQVVNVHERNVRKPTVKEYINTEVSNKLLKQIREATKAEDFKKILQVFPSCNVLHKGQKPPRVLNQSVLDNLSDIYEEFFGKHFDYLSSICASQPWQFIKFIDGGTRLGHQNSTNLLTTRVGLNKNSIAFCKRASYKVTKSDMECRVPPPPPTLLPSQVKSRELDRKVLRETLYSEIFQRHRRSIFALGSFLRMLKTKKSNYNVIKQDGESETE